MTLDRTQRTLDPRGYARRVFGTLALLAGSVFAAACDVHGASDPGSLSTLVVSPNSKTLAINGVQQFTAVGKDFAGVEISTNPTWTIASGGGSISAGGLFTAGTVPGTYANTVVATSGSLSSSATVIVTVGTLASVTVTPNPDTLAVNGVRQYVAVGRDVAGNIIPITPTWSVTNGGGSIGSSTGFFTAGTVPGVYSNTIRATVGAVAATATVTVRAGALASIVVAPNPTSLNTGDTLQFVATGRDVAGNSVGVVPVWTVANGGGSIGASSGRFTAGMTAGTFANTIVATVGSISGSATVTVMAGALASIIVTPNPVTLSVGTAQQFVATGRDASNNPVLITAIWSVVNGGGVINADSGVFTAGMTIGTFTGTVLATSGTVSGSATVTVATSGQPPVVNLGAAAPNGIMAGTAVTCVSGGIINADVSVSPGNTVTGFGPCVITGVQNLANPVADQAQLDLTTAYNTLAGMACPPANAIVANLGGTTKQAGVYCTNSGIGVTGTLTLDGGGDPNAVFVFQAGSGLTTAGDIVLINRAQAKNVYWQVGTSATIGTASQWKGNILALTSITLVENATLIGRALARNGAVSLGANNVITLP